MNALNNLFLNELADMQDSEQRIIKALPKVIKAATCDKLKQALSDHLEETQGQVGQLERVFAIFAEKPRSRKCPAMVGILDEGEKLISEYGKTPAINAAIIAACQKVEHYEIASYGTLRAWARLLGKEDAAEILEEILDQEKDADHTLNDLAVAKNKETLNEVAAGASA